MNNNGTKRKVGADDEHPNKRAPEGIKKNQRSSSFQKPGPASSKKAFHEQNIEKQSSSSFQRPGPACSKKGSIDRRIALDHQSTPTSKRSQDLCKDGPEDRIIEFIRLVRKFPHLYNPKDPSYKNSAKKQKSWTIVSEILGMSTNDCRVYWQVLCDKYSQERIILPENMAEDFRMLMETDLKSLEPITQLGKPVGNTFVSDHSTKIAKSLESRLPTTSPQSPDIETLSPSDQPRDPVPKILISINKRNSVRQSRTSFSVSPARSSSSDEATVQKTTFGSSSIRNTDERESTSFNDDEECDNSSGYDGSSVEEDHDDDEDVVNGVDHSSEKNANASLDDATIISEVPRTDNNSLQNIDQLFANTLLAIFRQFSQRDKNLILSKFVRCIIKFQKDR